MNSKPGVASDCETLNLNASRYLSRLKGTQAVVAVICHQFLELSESFKVSQISSEALRGQSPGVTEVRLLLQAEATLGRA